MVLVRQNMAVPHVPAQPVEMRRDTGYFLGQHDAGVFPAPLVGFRIAGLPLKSLQNQHLLRAAFQRINAHGLGPTFIPLPVEDLVRCQVQVDGVGVFGRIVHFPNFGGVHRNDLGGFLFEQQGTVERRTGVINAELRTQPSELVLTLEQHQFANVHTGRIQRLNGLLAQWSVWL